MAAVLNFFAETSVLAGGKAVKTRSSVGICTGCLWIWQRYFLTDLEKNYCSTYSCPIHQSRILISFFFTIKFRGNRIEYNVILKNFGYFEMDTCNKSLLTDRIWIAKKAKFRNQHFTVMHFTQIVTDSDSLSTGSFCSWSLPGVTEDWSWSDWKSGNDVHQWKLLLCFGHSCINLKVENRNRLIYFFLFQTLKNSLSNLFSV